MSTKPKKSVLEVSRELQRYSLDAFEFLHRGLDYTVQRAHGPPAAGMAELLDWLHAHGTEPEELGEALAAGDLPEPIQAFIQQLGGADEVTKRLNRHVDGTELCWGLRDLALERWGLMAQVVLRHWGIRSTKDFGYIVFALVENGLLQKQPHDVIDDFVDVYEFDKDLDRAYEIELPTIYRARRDTE
jgi:uncharacterized repeat protein (TIGR04138 family)